jgi:hypothetical protein
MGDRYVHWIDECLADTLQIVFSGFFYKLYNQHLSLKGPDCLSRADSVTKIRYIQL